MLVRQVSKYRALVEVDDEGGSIGGRAPRSGWIRNVVGYGSIIVALFPVFATSYIAIDD